MREASEKSGWSNPTTSKTVSVLGLVLVLWFCKSEYLSHAQDGFFASSPIHPDCWELDGWRRESSESSFDLQ